MNSRSPSFYFLTGICVLSVFDLNGTQAGILFVFIAVALGLQSRRKNEIVPPVLFVIVAYLAAFPFPMLFPDLYPDIWNNIPHEAVEYGMLWALRGFSALAFSYALVSRWGFRKRRQRTADTVLDKARLSYTVYLLTSIGWLALLAWILSVMSFGIGLTFIESEKAMADSGAGSLAQLFTLLSDLRYPFFLGFLILRFWEKVDGQLFFLFVALILVSLVEIIAIGSKGSIIGVVVMLLLAQSVLSIKFGAKMIATGAVAVIAVYFSFATITEYRFIMMSRHAAAEAVFDFSVQLESFKAAALASMPFSEKHTTRNTEIEGTTIYSRFGSGMFSFANLLNHTGGESLYENAVESLLIPLYAISPRFLMPEKPEFFSSGSNAKQYYGWSYGGIAVTLPGSFYYAWGYIGIILGLAFFGGLLAYFIDRVRGMGIHSPYGLIFLPFLLMNMIYVDVTFQALFTNLIRLAVVLWLLHLVFPLVRGAMWRRILRMSGPNSLGKQL